MSKKNLSDFELQNNHNVYILGAGFGTLTGLPTINTFMDHLRMALDRPDSKKNEIEALKALLNFRLNSAAASFRTIINLDNVEELFSLASSSSNNDQLIRHMQTAIAATLEFSQKTSEKNPIIPFHTSDLKTLKNSPIYQNLSRYKNTANNESEFRAEIPAVEAIAGGLAGYFSETTKQKNTFITFNYDTSLEKSLAQFGKKVSYGIPPSDLKSCPKWISNTGIKVLKLHGSTNWATDENSNLTYVDSYSELASRGQSPLLIPPTWRKQFENHFSNIWNSAIDEIKTATRIIIIGFSMPATDIHFKYLLASGLQRNISLRKILVIDPNVENIKQRYLSVLRPELVEHRVVEFMKCEAKFILLPHITSLIDRCLSREITILPIR